MTGDADLVAQGYNAVYTAMPRSPTLLRIWKENAAGADFPDEFYHISFVTLADLRKMASELRLSAGMTLGDLGCGMGGPGLWLARETGAILVGVDLSPVAVAQAARRAESLGVSDRARFSVGSFEATGLDAESVDAVMSIDALQYAPDKRGALREIRRILRPQGRLVFAAFELDPGRVAGLPVIGSDPVDDYRGLLGEAGFEVFEYQETPGWRERLTAAYGGIAAAGEELAAEMGPLAAAALLSEVTLTLQSEPYRRRVSVVAAKN